MFNDTILENAQTYVKNNNLPLEKYQVLLPEITLYQNLFRLRYKEDVDNEAILGKILGLKEVSEVVNRNKILDDWLRIVMNGEIRKDWVRFVCPECLNVALADKPEQGDLCCTACSLVVDASYEETIPFDDHLDRDVTMQPTAPMSFYEGLGNTIKSTDLHHLVRNNDTDFKTFKEEVPQVAEKLGKDNFALFNGFFYRLIDGRVRRIQMGDVDNLFNQLDKPLRKYKLGQVNDSFTTANKPILSYATGLCAQYGITDKVFIASLGMRVKSMRATLKMLGNSRPRQRPIVDTAFFLTLLDFHKSLELARAKPYLQIRNDIFNLTFDFHYFKLKHKERNFDSTMIEAYEKALLSRFQRVPIDERSALATIEIKVKG
jgi:hypothetical protein